MNGRERIKAVRRVFPRYDQPLDSKCNHPERYGIQRTPEAEALAQGTTSPDRARAARSDFRTKPNKHTFWLGETQEGYMHMARRLCGDGKTQASVQSVVEKALELLFERMEEVCEPKI